MPGKRKIFQMLQAARAGCIGKLHSLLIIKGGKLVVEEYFRGAHRDQCQIIASVSKSLVSPLVGMALEQSPRWSVDTQLTKHYPQYTEMLKQQGKADITLAHALTMTDGLDWDELTYRHPDPRNPNTQMYDQPDLKALILGRK